MVEFRPQEDPLGNGVESWREGTPGIVKIRHGCGVVGKYRDRGVDDRGEKVMDRDALSRDQSPETTSRPR